MSQTLGPAIVSTHPEGHSHNISHLAVSTLACLCDDWGIRLCAFSRLVLCKQCCDALDYACQSMGC